MLFPMIKDDFFMTPNYSPIGLRNKFSLDADILMTDDSFKIVVDMPGFKKEDINISLLNKEIIIEATRTEEKNEKDENGTVIRQERSFGKAYRKFYVGNIKEEDITATMENGVLTVECKRTKEEEKEKKKIEVK